MQFHSPITGASAPSIQHKCTRESQLRQSHETNLLKTYDFALQQSTPHTDWLPWIGFMSLLAMYTGTSLFSRSLVVVQMNRLITKVVVAYIGVIVFVRIVGSCLAGSSCKAKILCKATLSASLGFRAIKLYQQYCKIRLWRMSPGYFWNMSHILNLYRLLF